MFYLILILLKKAYEENICIENMLNHSKAIDRRWNSYGKTQYWMILYST